MSLTLRVLAGRPTEAELAAVLAVVGAALPPPEPPDAAPAWLRAARLEGVGGPPVAGPNELGRAGRRGDQPLTSSCPSMPASWWPGMEQ
ncbi:hypothetical protein BH20ACT9_BH20ACT9_02500 [soil metagenome]